MEAKCHLAELPVALVQLFAQEHDCPLVVLKVSPDFIESWLYIPP
jgi:hypothetical protein